MLTPRSKIRALLATVESSDDENGFSTTMKTYKLPRLSTKSLAHTGDSLVDGDSDSPGSDAPIRPRGKLASRMQGAATTIDERSITDHTSNTHTDESRIENTPEAPAPGGYGGNQGDKDLSVASERLQRRITRSPSPGLFVSSPSEPSASPLRTAPSDHDFTNEIPISRADRLKALVEKKRQERLQKEAEEEARREEPQDALEQEGSSDDEDEVEIEIEDQDDAFTATENGAARPARRAGRKAIEEMNRETQRMARNMQLAHEAKTRKKVTKASLFERFNYKPAGSPLPAEAAPVITSVQASPKSNADKEGEKETPPSSPPAENNGEESLPPILTNMEMEAGRDDVAMDDSDDDLPSLKDIQISEPRRTDKGKEKMPPLNPELTINLVEPAGPSLTHQRRFRVRLPMPSSKVMQDDADDELQIVATAKDRINAVFNSIPLVKSSETQSMQALRTLAHVRSPGKEARRGKDRHPGMTPGELQTYLQQKARQQAKVERDRRLELLKAQGVTFESAEERERQMQEVEDILAKAREEGERIGQEEKAAAKKERQERGDVDPLAWDSSDADEEYEGHEEDDDEDGSELELSGSEEEGEEMDVEEGAGEPVETSPSDVDIELDDPEELPAIKRTRKRKPVTLVSDDEDQADILIKATPETRTPAKTPMKLSSAILNSDPVAPTSALRSAKKTFIPGLPVESPGGLGLTQIFAGTMDDGLTSQAPGPTPSIMPDFTQPPSPNSPATKDDDAVNGVDDMVIDSQAEIEATRMEPTTQFTSTIEPTQDGGLQTQTPLLQRFMDLPSTVDTMANHQQAATIPESPLILKGRLRRKADLSVAQKDDTQETIPLSSGSDVFSKMKEAARKQQTEDDFDKRTSKAREMVEEQAEESEDEYAGLGGADGEFSDDDDSGASVHEFLDDAAGNNVNEGKLAAFYADQEVAHDQKEVEKLYKDVTTGRLRKRRAADYDLSDSDDGGEALRRMKRRQFQQMQKSLFADERVKKVAEDPGNQAFIRTIEDRGSDDEIILGDFHGVGSQSEETQTRESSVPAEQRKASSGTASGSRLPARHRRTKDAKKPSNLGEIRETVSNLLDERWESVIPATAEDGDSDDDEAPVQPHLGRRPPTPQRASSTPAIVDRMKKKQPGAGSSTGGRMAFTTAGGPSSGSSSFKVPALLRRATTNSSLGSASTTFSATSTRSDAGGGGGGSGSGGAAPNSGGFGADTKIKKGAGKKSGVHGFTRDMERNARIKENERRREERKIKGAESRAGLVGGLLGKGTFG